MTDKDCLFLQSSILCVACTREGLPSLNSHNVQQYTLAIQCDQMKPTDPSNRRYDLRQLDQNDFQEVANACSVLFSWANISKWHPTAVMHLYFTATDNIIPRRRSKMSLSSTHTKILAAARHSHSGRRLAEIARWWENRNNKAMAAKLHFPLEKVKSVSITSSTTHTIKLKKNKLQVVDEISADGKDFPKEKAVVLRSHIAGTTTPCSNQPTRRIQPPPVYLPRASLCTWCPRPTALCTTPPVPNQETTEMAHSQQLPHPPRTVPSSARVQQCLSSPSAMLEFGLPRFPPIIMPTKSSCHRRCAPSHADGWYAGSPTFMAKSSSSIGTKVTHSATPSGSTWSASSRPMHSA